MEGPGAVESRDGAPLVSGTPQVTDRSLLKGTPRRPHFRLSATPASGDIIVAQLGPSCVSGPGLRRQGLGTKSPDPGRGLGEVSSLNLAPRLAGGGDARPLRGLEI